MAICHSEGVLPGRTTEESGFFAELALSANVRILRYAQNDKDEGLRMTFGRVFTLGAAKGLAMPMMIALRTSC